MKQNRKQDIWRNIVYILLISAAFLLETTYGFMPHLGNARLLPMLPLLSCVCMFEKERLAPWYGLFAGFLMDMVSPSMVGYHALILLLICTLIGWLSSNWLRNTLLTNLLAGSLLVFFNQSLYWLFFIEFKQTAGAGAIYWSKFVPTILMNILLVLPFFFLVLSVKKHFKAEEEA